MTYPFSGILVRFKMRNAGTENARDSESGSELHVNLWDLKGLQYLDLGIMVKDIGEIDSIVIDLPWELKKNRINDLGTKLDSEKLLTAVFNESVAYESDSSNDITKVKLQNKKTEPKDFLLLRINTTDIKLQHINSNEHVLTRVVLNIGKYLERNVTEKNNYAYIRLRFIDVPRAVFITEFHPKDRNLLSSSPITHLLDLRVNVRRGVPDEIGLHDSTLLFPELKKVHVFVIVSRDTELPFHSENYKGCRSLEDEEIWNNYLGLSGEKSRNSNTIKGCIGYQWSASKKNGESVKDLIALGRFVKLASSTLKSYKFIAIMLWLSIFGNVLWTAIRDYFNNDNSQQTLITAILSTVPNSPWWFWVVFILIPLAIIHIDSQSIRNCLSAVKRNGKKLKSHISRWWANI